MGRGETSIAASFSLLGFKMGNATGGGKGGSMENTRTSPSKQDVPENVSHGSVSESPPEALRA